MAKRTWTCKTCGNPITYTGGHGKGQCKACYHKRGVTPKPPTMCGLCKQRPISRGSQHGFCATCYRTHRKEIEVARERQYQDTLEDRDAIPMGQPFEQAWQTFQTEIGCAEERYQGPAAKRSGARVKILVVPDLHVPFHDAAAVATMITREADADI